MSLIQEIELCFVSFKEELKNISNIHPLLELKSKYIGKTGQISQLLKGLKDLSNEDKKLVGPVANEIKNQIEEICNEVLKRLEKEEADKTLSERPTDLSFRDSVKSMQKKHGGYHPVTAIQREIEGIFASMGFEILDGPHVEDEYHNFEALNIPKNHPARDMQDTFWFHHPHKEEDGFNGKKFLLRTHTSTIQVRGMKNRKPPFRFIAPGKVFRAERTDASHEMVFHQLEGMYVSSDTSVAHLIYFMKTLLSEVFRKNVEVRLRPGFFPFVEPGFELDIRCLICAGNGCSVCKHLGWVELLPCGMVHPNVLKSGGIDPNEYRGFAFGLGLDRLVMMRYGINDIRLLHGSDMRFLSQFSSY